MTLEGSTFDRAEGSPGFLFWKAFNAWSRQIRAALEDLELTQPQYSVLAATSYMSASGQHVTQQAVANQLSMDKMTVSDVVKTLEAKKFLKRKPHPEDGRAFALSLTSLAEARMKAAVPAVEGADAAYFGRLGASERKDLMKCLLALTAAK